MDDTSVASAASGALVAMCARFPNEVPRELREVLATTSREGATSESKVRGVAFAASVAGANADAAAAVVRSGALDECVREIDGADLLASLASLEILAEVAEASAAANGLKSIDALSATLVRVVLDENADVALRTRALVVGGRIAATVSSGDDAFVVEMTRVIDEASRSECGRELSDAAIDALGAVSVARSRVASAVVLRAKSVVADAAHKSFRGTGESQIVALHALANVFGAERSRDATLDDDAERVLADVCFAACGSKPFAKVIHDAITAKSDHFLNLRVAVYRFLSAQGGGVRSPKKSPPIPNSAARSVETSNERLWRLSSELPPSNRSPTPASPTPSRRTSSPPPPVGALCVRRADRRSRRRHRASLTHLSYTSTHYHHRDSCVLSDDLSLDARARTMHRRVDSATRD